MTKEQEPVAWMWTVNNGGGYISRGIGFDQTNIPFAVHTPLYTQPKQKPLEEEWIAHCWNKSLIGHRISYVQYLELVREVERAHGIKE